MNSERNKRLIDGLNRQKGLNNPSGRPDGPGSRRDFLKFFFFTSLPLAIGAGVVKAIGIYAEGRVEEQYAGGSELEKNLDILERYYQIKVDFSPVTPEEQDSGIWFSQLPEENKGTAVETILEEIGKYPPSLINDIEFKKIKLVSQLEYDGKRIYGLSQGDGGVYLDSFSSGHEKDKITGVDILYERFQDANGDRQTAYLLHWSVWDKIENEFKDYVDVLNWKSLNPDGFLYFEETELTYSSEEQKIEAINEQFKRNKNYFFDKYAVIEEREDRFETAWVLMTDPEKLAGLEPGSPLLVKAAYIKTLFKVASQNQMDERYWKNLKANKVDYRYWK